MNQVAEGSCGEVTLTTRPASLAFRVREELNGHLAEFKRENASSRVTDPLRGNCKFIFRHGSSISSSEEGWVQKSVVPQNSLRLPAASVFSASVGSIPQAQSHAP